VPCDHQIKYVYPFRDFQKFRGLAIKKRAGICSVVDQSLKIVKMPVSFSVYENVGLFYKAI
jgi:hypothetical protein